MLTRCYLSCDFSVTVSVTVIFSVSVSVNLFQSLLQLQLFLISTNCTNNEQKHKVKYNISGWLSERHALLPFNLIGHFQQKYGQM